MVENNTQQVGFLLVTASLIAEEVGRRLTLTGDGPFTIGRDESCDFTVNDHSASRRHAQLIHREGTWRLIDLGSSNGLFVGPNKIQDIALEPGKTFRIGTTTLCLQVADSAPAEQPAPDAVAKTPARSAPPSRNEESRNAPREPVPQPPTGPAGAPAAVEPAAEVPGEVVPPTRIVKASELDELKRGAAPKEPSPAPAAERKPTPRETAAAGPSSKPKPKEARPSGGGLLAAQLGGPPKAGGKRQDKPTDSGAAKAEAKAAKEAEKPAEGDSREDSNDKEPPNLLGVHEPGSVYEISGINPFLLDGKDLVWIVEKGKVEVFTVNLENGAVVGSRTHYLTVGADEALFGMDLNAYGAGSGFLVVGHLGTRVRCLRRSDLSAMSQRPAEREKVTRWIEVWVDKLSARLTVEIPSAPQADINLEPGDRAELSHAQVARGSRGVVWLARERGGFLYIGMNTSPASAALFPIQTNTWVEGYDEFGVQATFTAVSTHEALDTRGFWDGLEEFHRSLCQCEFINKRLAVVDEYNRLRTKADNARAAREEAVDKLASVLQPKAGVQVDSDRDGSALLQAVRLVASTTDINVREPLEMSEDLDYEERLSMIGKASGFRTRVVALRDKWWREDNGAILARLEETGSPVAVLPNGPKSHQYVDPTTGASVTVNEQNSDELRGLAYVLYRSFPEGPVKLLNMVRFGLLGLRRDVFWLIAMAIGLGALGAVTPYFTGRIFDSAIPEAERGYLVQFCAALLVTAIASTAFKLVQSVSVMRLQGHMDYAIQAALWDRLLNLPSVFFRKFSAGDLADRAAGINAIRGLIAGAGIASVLGSLSSVFYFGLMFFYSVPLGLVAVGLTLVFVAFTFCANYMQLRLQRSEFDRRGRLTGLVLQLIAGVSKVRVSGAENHAFKVWASDFSGMRRTSFKIGRIQNSVAVFNTSFPIYSNMALFFMLYTVQEKAAAAGVPSSLSTGEFIAFSSAYGMFLVATQSMSDASLNLLRAVPIYERLRPIVTTEAEVDEAKAHPGTLKGQIELSHLHFRYLDDGPYIVRDLTLSIKQGEFVAFVGSSGSGKSTVMRLMLGFETPEKGSIYYDGQDLRNMDVRALRQQLGVVLQDSRVLPADLFRNIVGTSSKTIDDAWEAARMAGLEEDIQGMPMGMHTYVSEGGGGLSGGQRQRLLIARALVNKPRIIFMDEATSALDNQTQAIVTESMNRLQATRVVIAHRLSTIIGADRICYLDNGVIAEVGSYDELMALDGLFAALAKRQVA